MAEMKAWRIHKFGGVEVLQCDTVQRPEPATGDVLVRIAATSINPVDYKTRDGEFPAIGGDDLPVILGRDVAGTVVSGDGFNAGDRVYGMPGFDRGSYAEYVVMKPSELAHLPDPVDFAQAGGAPLAALTAWQGLFDHGRLKKGERVLILGAPGGVGHLAVQFAKHAGAAVLTTGHARDEEFLRRMGADKVIDSDNQSLASIGAPVDLVYDLLGGDAQSAAWAAIADNGRFVSTLEEPDGDKAGKPGVRTAHYMAEPNGGQLADIADLMRDGAVRVVVQERFGFKQLPQAQRALEEQHAQGKIVVML